MGTTIFLPFDLAGCLPVPDDEYATPVVVMLPETEDELEDEAVVEAQVLTLGDKLVEPDGVLLELGVP